MPTITISILPDGIPVDMMDDDDDGNSCPLPTQDADINTENKDVAVSEYNYKAAVTDDECGNCGMYNQTETILECIGDDTGDVGYCQLLKFCCSSENTCSEWVEGGPITSDQQEDYKDIL